MKPARLMLFAIGAQLWLGCSSSDMDLSQAKPYEIAEGTVLATTNGRSARSWYITSEATSFEEYAQTLMKAAVDLQREHHTDYTSVSLVPSKRLAAFGIRYAHGYYATDRRAGQGLSGADPHYRARWRVFAAEGRLTERELAIAELWKEKARDFPSRDMTSSLGIDQEALRRYIADKLEFPYDEVKLPELATRIYLEVLE